MYEESDTVPTVVARMDTSDDARTQGTLMDPQFEMNVTQSAPNSMENTPSENGQNLDQEMRKDTKEDGLQAVSKVQHAVETGGGEVSNTHLEGDACEHEVTKKEPAVSEVNHEVVNAESAVNSIGNETEHEMEVGSDTPHATCSLKNEVTKTENKDLSNPGASSLSEPEATKNDSPSIQNAHTEHELTNMSLEGHSEVHGVP